MPRPGGAFSRRPPCSRDHAHGANVAARRRQPRARSTDAASPVAGPAPRERSAGDRRRGLAAVAALELGREQHVLGLAQPGIASHDRLRPRPRPLEQLGVLAEAARRGTGRRRTGACRSDRPRCAARGRSRRAGSRRCARPAPAAASRPGRSDDEAPRGVLAAPDAAAKLVELGEAEALAVLHQHHRRVRARRRRPRPPSSRPAPAPVPTRSAPSRRASRPTSCRRAAARARSPPARPRAAARARRSRHAAPCAAHRRSRPARPPPPRTARSAGRSRTPGGPRAARRGDARKRRRARPPRRPGAS